MTAGGARGQEKDGPVLLVQYLSRSCGSLDTARIHTRTIKCSRIPTATHANVNAPSYTSLPLATRPIIIDDSACPPTHPRRPTTVHSPCVIPHTNLWCPYAHCAKKKTAGFPSGRTRVPLAAANLLSASSGWHRSLSHTVNTGKGKGRSARARAVVLARRASGLFDAWVIPSQPTPGTTTST